VLLVLASMLNPIGLRFVIISGVGASFALTWGLLRVRDVVASRTAERPAGAPPPRRDLSWIVAAAAVAVTFVGLLVPGIRLSR